MACALPGELSFSEKRRRLPPNFLQSSESLDDKRGNHDALHIERFQAKEKIMTLTERDGNVQSLAGTTVAILVTDGFEQAELTGPREALENVGATTRIISGQHGKVQGFNHDARADAFDADLTFDEASPDDFNAVLLPGGAFNSDRIRIIPQAQRFVQDMQETGKPVAVICHGAWLLVSAGLVKGRTVTSWPTLQDDIRNAGGNWVDQEVVVDGNWVSSRKPDDIPAFNQAFIDLLAQSARTGGVRGIRDQHSGMGLSG
jgi:protease I